MCSSRMEITRDNPTAPGEKGSAVVAESRKAGDKSRETRKLGKLGRTKERADGVGDLNQSSARRPLTRRPHRSHRRRRRQCWQPPAVSETQKGHEEPGACLNGLPVFARTPICSNIQLCGLWASL